MLLRSAPPARPLRAPTAQAVNHYGEALKAVVNEKFGDGIMSGAVACVRGRGACSAVGGCEVQSGRRHERCGGVAAAAQLRGGEAGAGTGAADPRAAAAAAAAEPSLSCLSPALSLYCLHRSHRLLRDG